MQIKHPRARLAAVAVSGALVAGFALVTPTAFAAPTAPALSPLGTYDTGLGEGGSEIVAFDKHTQRMFVVNASEGTVDVVDISDAAAPVKVAALETPGANSVAVRISGPGATVAQDLEPEYVAIDQESHTAYVTLQENNAIAVVDLASASVTDLQPLGLKDHALPGNGLDASDKDKKINIANWLVKGLYMPDGIAAFKTGGSTYTITANEGDAREYDGWEDEKRIKSLTLDPTVFPDAADLQKDANIGRLNVVIDSPKNPAGQYTELWSYGARSVTIRDASGALLWDSGDALEQLVAEFDAATFNESHNGEGTFDDRSDNKGPEPESVVVGQVKNRTLAFVGLERTSGIAVFDVTNPRAVTTVGYYENAGDFGPEGLEFVPASASPSGQPLLLVGNEISGTTTVWQVNA